MEEKTFDVIIIGSGPAGLTAGIYTARAALKTLIIAGVKWGGQLMQTTLVENFPGFPDGIQGPELMMNMRKQAEKMGAVILNEDAQNFDVSERPFKISTQGSVLSAQSIIIATGAEFNWLGLPNEQRLIGRGVSSCATCDAAFFKNKKVAVVGGGDAAMEEALVLSKFASEVIVIHRRAEFRASKVMQERVLNHPKIKVMWNTTVVDVVGENKVEGVKVKSQIQNSKIQINSNIKMINEKMPNEEIQEIPVDGVFVAIGHSPATGIFKDKILLDEKNYVKKVKRDGFNMMTSVDGVFVAGDVHDIHYKQAITAAGYGCEAALEVEKWLDTIK